MKEHIDHHFDEALAGLKQQVRLMGRKVESMVADAVRAVSSRDVVLARQVIERDHPVNALEVAIDEQCIELLARYQPAASDLRFITRGLKIVTDLERIGDLAVNMANRALDLAREGAEPLDLSGMVAEVQRMLNDAIDAFVSDDEAKAEGVLEADDVVDDYTEKYVTALLDEAAREPAALRRVFPMSSVVRYLERIADHSTNIAEQAIFHLRGHDVRHRKPR